MGRRLGQTNTPRTQTAWMSTWFLAQQTPDVFYDVLCAPQTEHAELDQVLGTS